MKGLADIIKDNNPNGDHKEYTKKKEFEFDELGNDLQDEVIEDFLRNDSSVYEYARDQLRHFVFDGEGNTVREYDE